MTENSVRRAILNHKTLSIRRLRISTRILYDDEDEGEDSVRLYGWERNFFEELMARYIARVEELHLRVEGYLSTRCKSPKGIVLAGRSLRVLEIDGCDITDAVHMDLTCVETLSLHNVRVRSDEALNNLISSCPNVRNLDLDFWCQRVTRIDLSLSQLEKMVISCSTSLRKFTIDAPKLHHAVLRYPGEGLVFSMGNSFDLTYAQLQVYYWMHDDMLIRNLIYEFAVSKVLVLDFHGDHHLPMDLFEKSPPRCSVKKLEVNGDVTLALLVLKLFSNLEDFTFLCSRDDSRSSDNEDGELMDFQDVEIYCLKNSLKSITVTGFRGCDIEAEFMTFLVENAKVLEAISTNGMEACLTF